MTICAGLGLAVLQTGGRRTVNSAAPPAPPVAHATLQLGEELEYRVHYWFVTIGSVQFKITDSLERDGRTVYRAESIVNSNPALSWLTQTHLRCSSEIDQEGFSYAWACNDSSSKGVTYQNIQFDYPNERMYYSRGEVLASGECVQTSVDTVPVSDRSADGVSLMYYARQRAHQKADEHVPAFLNKKQVFLDVNFLNERMDMNHGAIGYPIGVIHFKGRANFVGAAGLTGAFDAWVSDDDARVVMAARLKVFLGSVKVELAKWNRAEWTPPKCATQLSGRPSSSREHGRFSLADAFRRMRRSSAPGPCAA